MQEGAGPYDYKVLPDNGDWKLCRADWQHFGLRLAAALRFKGRLVLDERPQTA